MQGNVLVLGASGKAGHHAARVFGAAGWQVHRYARGTDMTAAARGCDVIVNGLNPPDYHAWDRLIPEITASVIAAARAGGASVIIPGNVYNFGDRGGVWSERTPHRPNSRKGRIRVEMEAAYREAGIRTIILRAGNMIDPEVPGCVMRRMILKDISRGRIVAPGRRDVVQPWAYVPDWARAALGLAQIRDGLAPFEDVPFPGHDFSLEDLRAGLETTLGRPLRFAAFPWWALRAASPFWELARELLEMRYLWDLPHSLDGGRLAQLLPGFRPSPLAEVFAAGLPEGLRPAPARAA